ncbi:MAG: efflux RND transporter periplasmic adaptor subunit [Blastocatellia bacterium]
MSDNITHKDSSRDSLGDRKAAPVNSGPERTGEAESHGNEPQVKRVRVKDSRNRNLFIIAGVIAVVVILALMLWPRGSGSDKTTVNVSAGEKDEHGEEGGHEEGKEVELEPEAVEAAGIQIVEVSERNAGTMLRVTGTVEANQQQTQQVTPLVTGRVERVNVVLGDRVRAGSVLAVVSSPEVAEMHGKLHEAETKLTLAEQNYARVQRAENRVSVLSAKARLDEAEATLRRTHRLIELGAGAGKDLVAAETAYKTAKADYDYQNNISINREVQEARAEVETTHVEVLHLRNSLRALGATIDEDKQGNVRHDTSTIALTAPVSGTVTERAVNAGAGIEVGKPLFTISNISTVWVIANVPEGQIGLLRTGTSAEVRSAALGTNAISGKVAYIDPNLSEETRTARVRVEAANPGEHLKVGMFVEVSFEAGAPAPGREVASELVIPETAIQRIGDRTVVFLPKEEPGHFEVRDVEIGGVVDGYQRIISGLALGDRVVTKGSFTLKTQLMKGEMGEHGH